MSPLTEAVLGETLLTVTEEKVSITQLQAQVVASLALSLRPSPGSSHTILATTAAQPTLSFAKQVTDSLKPPPPQPACEVWNETWTTLVIHPSLEEVFRYIRSSAPYHSVFYGGGQDSSVPVEGPLLDSQWALSLATLQAHLWMSLWCTNTYGL